MSDFFVMLGDAKDLRRKILESSKASLNVLRGYQELIKIRGEKQTIMKEMRRDLKEITMLLNRVEFLLPEVAKGEVSKFVPGEGLPSLPRSGKRPRKKSKGRKVFLGEPLPALPPVRIAAPVREPERIPDDASPDDKLAEIERRLSRLSDRLGKL